nr:MAG TPA: hypothetical protein [Caudoviricetes sp.]
MRGSSARPSDPFFRQKRGVLRSATGPTPRPIKFQPYFPTT